MNIVIGMIYKKVLSLTLNIWDIPHISNLSTTFDHLPNTQV